MQSFDETINNKMRYSFEAIGDVIMIIGFLFFFQTVPHNTYRVFQSLEVVLPNRGEKLRSVISDICRIDRQKKKH